ncbi:MAG: hypothetical protein HY909_25240 [Deltaproteobacteria bacterium]|nr:hypothetical protein [Deltaproteobacteria bacterium]
MNLISKNCEVRRIGRSYTSGAAKYGCVPNKPMVPTALDQFADYSPARSRRHIGRPLGSLEERRIGQRANLRELRNSRMGVQIP